MEKQVLTHDFDCSGFFFVLQETDQEKVVAVRTSRRGRSSRTSEESEKEPEKQEETPSRGGRRPGAKGAAAGKSETQIMCFIIQKY